MNPVKASRSAIVVGGGVIGLFTAWRLLDAGFGVTVIERARVGGSASWAGGGILCPLPPWQAPAAVWALAIESIETYHHLVEELTDVTGIDPQYHQCGMCVLDDPDPQAAQQWAAFVGMAIHQQQRSSGLQLPWVAQLRSPRLLKALKAYLSQRDVCWLEESAVTAFKTAADRVESLQINGADSHGADVIVLCTGAWSGAVCALLGLPLPVVPVRGQMLLFEAAEELLSEIVLRGSHYLIPRRDGRIAVGSTLEWTGFDDRTTTAAYLQLREAACHLLPALRDCKVSHHWAALRPGSDDGVPTIERVEGFNNLFLNTGHFRNGITLAPASATRLMSFVSA